MRMWTGVFTVVMIKLRSVWVMTPHGLVDGYKRFGGTYCLHFQGRLPDYEVSLPRSHKIIFGLL
jgi:hypothetical protein